VTIRSIGHAALICLLLASGPATAQDADDWDYGEDPSRQTVIAAITFANFGVAVRCIDENLSVVLSGLPAASGERTMRYRMGDGAETDSRWISGRDSTAAFSIWPRAVGTELSRGGRLSLDVPDGERRRRFAVDLPPSTASVARVFRACGHELPATGNNDAPAGDNLAGLIWIKVPEVSFPDRSNYGVGLAAINCTARANGRLRDCTIESEFPEGSGFGRAATYGAHRSGQVGLAEGSDGSMEGRKIAFVTRYSSYDEMLTPPPSRLPRRDEVYSPPPPPRDADK
jgi:hypothetical protein